MHSVPPLMPPRGMVMTSMKLWTMVLTVMNMSPWAPPKRCRRAFIPIIITLSMAMIAIIGGISQENIDQLSGCHVDGVAVVSAIFAADDPAKATAELKTLAEKMVKA